MWGYLSDYLDFLYHSVEQAVRDGKDVDKTVESVDLSGWDRKILPSLHNFRLTWATAENNVRSAFRIISKQSKKPSVFGTKSEES